mgnify:CR=1 FL=1
MSTTPLVHDSFRNVAPIQSFGIDTLIAEMERLRDAYLKNSARDTAKMTALIEQGEPTDSFSFILTQKAPISSLADYHDAFLILTELKKNGLETLELDTGKDMCAQIFDLATKESVPELYDKLSSNHRRTELGSGSSEPVPFERPAQG